MNGVVLVTLQPTGGARIADLWGRTSVCKSRRNSVTPKIMMTTEVSRLIDPCNVISPKPVVVSAATVK